MSVDLGKLERPRMAIPLPVIVAIILAGAWLGLQVYANLATARDPSAMSWLAVEALVSVLIMVGLVLGHALAWQWGIVIPILGAVGMLAAMVNPTPLYGGLLALLILLPLMLSLPASRVYYGLQCPQCQSRKVKAADFFFTRRLCKKCKSTWQY